MSSGYDLIHLLLEATRMAWIHLPFPRYRIPRRNPLAAKANLEYSHLSPNLVMLEIKMGRLAYMADADCLEAC